MGLDSSLFTLTGLWTVALVLASLRLIMELYQLYRKKVVGYFNDWVNWFELTEYISIIIFLVSVERSGCFCPQTWEWEVGVVSLALSWVVLVAWLQAMHWIGIYVTIMIRIIVSFARVAIFGVLLVVGFGLTFYLLFYQPPQGEIVVSFGRVTMKQIQQSFSYSECTQYLQQSSACYSVSDFTNSWRY